MALPELKQAASLIDRAAALALFVPERASADALASMVALYVALQASKPDSVDEISPSHVRPELMFLPGSSQVTMAPRYEPEVLIDIAGTTEVKNLRTQTLQGGVRLHVTLPANATVSKDQLEMSVRGMPYDVAVVFGATDVEDLGSIFSDNPGFFYSTPIINIDHRAGNEHFGTVNLVDITAGSVAEVTYDLVSELLPDGLDADIATALYAGVVAGTDSFQRPSTTPRSFQVAARLMELKADREAVIQHLVKTKPLALLKLAGRLYARLRVDEHVKLYWSIVREVDFKESSAGPEELRAAMYELTNNLADYNAAFVLREAESQHYEVLVMLGKGLLQRRQEIQEALAAKKENGLLSMMLTAPSLDEAENQALEQIRAILP